MATERDLLASQIILKAVLPVAKVVIEEVPAMKKKFQGVNATFQIQAKNGDENIGAYFKFTDGELEIVQGVHGNPDIRFAFGKPESMVAFLTGGIALPKIKGLGKPGLLMKCVGLLLSLTILLPNKRPKKYDQVRLKVKMVMYMITTALSQYNKGGDPEMVRWTTKQPDRIYQMSCEPEGIAAYVRVKAGKTKAGRGYYKRKHPFVHMKFHGAQGALPVFMNDVEFVEAVAKGYVTVEGAPEYAMHLNNHMQQIQALIT
ncbi:MAG: hypothetical protein CVV44_23055 [Spirochaetae bacterium HGW-Spirochaetae-1]|jgi:hypothetical protein|nr:MAG: hypothetical protein CVV44_23055 [Spirochaetae bacterium HGW-Spirochaetae-1]